MELVIGHMIIQYLLLSLTHFFALLYEQVLRPITSKVSIPLRMPMHLFKSVPTWPQIGLIGHRPLAGRTGQYSGVLAHFKIQVPRRPGY